MRNYIPLTLLFAAAALAAASAPPQSPSQSQPASPPFWSWANTPVMGWNSWDCYGAGVNEQQTLDNANYMKEKLLSHGYNLITVDIQWYEPLAKTDRYRPNAALEMDANGRLIPAANRFPLTKDTRSFKPLADQLHAMGLKFGLHLLRGIPRQAVTQNVPILNTDALKPGGIHAADIANTRDTCQWNTDMYGVDMTKPGAQEYYDSVLALMASWDLDFIKVDDLSAPNYHTPEVEAIRKAIDKTKRPIAFSTSPGATPVAQGKNVEMNANQWRISNDFWDNWGALQEQFARLDAWTPFRAPGHFPDADMLPVGNIRTWTANDNQTHFTHDEVITLMNLWCIARSPLIIGANLPKNDDFTLQALTNDEVLAVDQHSTHNKQLMHTGDLYAWVADAENSPDKYVALFNAPAAPPGRGRGRANPPATAATDAVAITVKASDLGFKHITAARDLWEHKDYGPLKDDTILSPWVKPHASVIVKVTGTP